MHHLVEAHRLGARTEVTNNTGEAVRLLEFETNTGRTVHYHLTIAAGASVSFAPNEHLEAGEHVALVIVDFEDEQLEVLVAAHS